MIKLYRYDIADFTEEEYFREIGGFSDNLREHIERNKNFSDRAASLVGYRLVLSAARELLCADKPRIAFDGGGKPYFENLPLYFSISHSGEKVIAALSDRPVGADIERRREVRKGVSERFFTEQEKKCDFFEIWTKKEAFGKCRGGLSYAFETDVTALDFYTEDDGEYVISVYEE